MLHVPEGSIRRRRHRAVFFDAGNTLFKPHASIGERYAEVAAIYGLRVDGGEVERAFREEWARRSGAKMLALASSDQAERKWWYDLVRSVFERMGQIERFDEYFDHLYDFFASAEAWRLYPEVEQVLAECERRGVILGVVSNWD